MSQYIASMKAIDEPYDNEPDIDILEFLKSDLINLKTDVIEIAELHDSHKTFMIERINDMLEAIKDENES